MLGWDIVLTNTGYDEDLNVTAFFWWNGHHWRLGTSAPYDAGVHSTNFGWGRDYYPVPFIDDAV